MTISQRWKRFQRKRFAKKMHKIDDVLISASDSYNCGTSLLFYMRPDLEALHEKFRAGQRLIRRWIKEEQGW